MILPESKRKERFKKGQSLRIAVLRKNFEYGMLSRLYENVGSTFSRGERIEDAFIIWQRELHFIVSEPSCAAKELASWHRPLGADVSKL
eukprot:m.349737 g.349737  ORF g.349737 m.349737 type:complete len:89 (+) comp43742_c0_seq1:111-377(+)